MDETFEMDCRAVVAGCEAAEVLQAVKASFDPISVSIEVDIVGE
jgi:hypothetical protein